VYFIKNRAVVYKAQAQRKKKKSETRVINMDHKLATRVEP
jgi:hypothetical protein